MRIGGVSIIFLLGMLNMVLVLFQISTGKRWLRLPFVVHRVSAAVLFFSAALHAFLAILVNWG